MKLFSSQSRRGEAAFTMVEIAISLAIIGFALVAIIGVLPTGMNVQKENREETIINQDATVLMDALRSGARGFNDLTNYVYAITNYVYLYETTGNGEWRDDKLPYAHFTNGYTYDGSYGNNGPITPAYGISNGLRIIGLMSVPKIQPIPQTENFVSNHVVVYVHALSGPATEKFPQHDLTLQDKAFNYRMISEVAPVSMFVDTNNAYGTNLQANLHEIRLAYRWPVLPNGSVGNSRMTFRTLASGRLYQTNEPFGSTPMLYFLEPSYYSNANAYAQ